MAKTDVAPDKATGVCERCAELGRLSKEGYFYRAPDGLRHIVQNAGMNRTACGTWPVMPKADLRKQRDNF